MKLEYYVAISIGLMILFYVAGIDTGSSQILTFTDAMNETLGDTNPYFDTTEKNSTEIEPEDILSGYSRFWLLFGGAILIFIVGVGTKITLLSSGVTFSSEAVLAGISGALFYVFAIDAWSVLMKVRTVTGGTGWIYYTLFSMGFIYLVLFAISLIKFTVRTE